MKWLKRIADKGTPLSKYANEAENWDRCVIGEARQAHMTAVVLDLNPEFMGTPNRPPRDKHLTRLGLPNRPPRDKHLTRLGLEFYNAVYANHRRKALHIYLAIQTRLARLAGVR